MIHMQRFVVVDGELPPELRHHDDTIQDLVAELYSVGPTESALEYLPGLCFAAKPDSEHDEVIGLINLAESAPPEYKLRNTAWITTLVVAEPYRADARRREPRYIGSLLVDRVRSIASRQGVGQLALEATPTSRKFWQRQGFRAAQKQPAQMDSWGTLMLQRLSW